LEVIETVGGADASVAWCLGQSAGCMTAAALLTPDVAREIYADRRATMAWGPLAKGGRAVKVEGGYRLTGTTQFLSGLHHARWVGARIVAVTPDGRPLPEGPRTFLMRREQVKIDNVWNVAGLRATGSDSIVLDDIFVADRHSFLLDEAPRETGTLYRFVTNAVFSIAFASVGLGLARAALDAFRDLVAHKSPTHWAGVMRDSALVQNQYAMAEAELRAARAYLRQTVSDAWASAEAGEGPTTDQKIDIRLAATHVIHAAKHVVDFAYQSAGASAIFAANPFERRFRDMHAVTQQIQASAAQFTNTGQILFGLAPANPRTL
jgi:alkylation response protein AidB-like acyl-CoA dehydrogenase